MIIRKETLMMCSIGSLLRTLASAFFAIFELCFILIASGCPAQAQWSGWAGLGGGMSQIATTRNIDGRIEVFAIGTDKALYHIWQTTPGGSAWSGWAGLGGGITQIASAINNDGRIEVFAIGTDKALNHIWQTAPGGSSWSGWAGLGGGVTQVASGLNNDGRIEVFAIGTDTALNHIWETTAPQQNPVWGFADLHAHPATFLGFGADSTGYGIFWGSRGCKAFCVNDLH
jgi:acylphosphatase